MSEQSNDSNRRLFKGVSYDKARDRYRASIMFNGKRYQAYFKSEAEAMDWYEEKSLELYDFDRIHAPQAELIDMKPSDSATPKSDSRSPSTPTSTDTKIGKIVEQIYHNGFEDGYKQKQMTNLAHFSTALKTLLTSEKNKAVAEYQRIFIDAVEIGLKGVSLSLNENEWLDLIAVLRESEKAALAQLKEME